MATQFTLQYWQPNGGPRLGRNVTRIYVNLGDGSERAESLGYFEKADVLRERDPNSPSYYERHRWAKGEDHAWEPGAVTFSGDPTLLHAICQVVFADRKVGLKGNWEDAFSHDPTGFWFALRENSRGFTYTVTGKYSKDKATREQAKVTERGNKHRQTLVFEM